MKYPWHATYHFGVIFSNNYDGNKYFIVHDPGGNCSKFSINFSRTYEMGVVDIDITMACAIYQFSEFFFSTKTMRITKIHFKHRAGKYDP